MNSRWTTPMFTSQLSIASDRMNEIIWASSYLMWFKNELEGVSHSRDEISLKLKLFAAGYSCIYPKVKGFLSLLSPTFQCKLWWNLWIASLTVIRYGMQLENFMLRRLSQLKRVSILKVARNTRPCNCDCMRSFWSYSSLFLPCLFSTFAALLRRELCHHLTLASFSLDIRR